MAASQKSVERHDALKIRPLTELPDIEQAVCLQRTVWGFADVDLLPPRLFIVAKKIGGQAFGAFEGAKLAGFCLSIPGLKPGGKHYLHSHMLGVLPEYRDRGVGRELKLAQRTEALSRDIDLIEWTFDPLEIKNARFNIERLGAIVRRFVPNQYGTTSSPLHGGLPTDRCVAEWWIASDRVKSVLAGRRPDPDVRARIAVPGQIAEWKKNHPAKARDAQSRVREQFERWFSANLAVIGYEVSDQGGEFLLGERL